MCNASISLMQLTRVLVRFACLVVCLFCLLDCECVLITLLILCCIHVVSLSVVCFMIFVTSYCCHLLSSIPLRWTILQCERLSLTLLCRLTTGSLKSWRDHHPCWCDPREGADTHSGLLRWLEQHTGALKTGPRCHQAHRLQSVEPVCWVLEWSVWH